MRLDNLIAIIGIKLMFIIIYFVNNNILLFIILLYSVFCIGYSMILSTKYITYDLLKKMDDNELFEFRFCDRLDSEYECLTSRSRLRFSVPRPLLSYYKDEGIYNNLTSKIISCRALKRDYESMLSNTIYKSSYKKLLIDLNNEYKSILLYFTFVIICSYMFYYFSLKY